MTQEKKYVLEDLGSINGTYVNDKQVTGAKVYLKHNDEIVNIICELFDAPKNVKILQ